MSLINKAILIVLLAAGGLFCYQNATWASDDHLVISEIYGGGGNSGATYKNDFIELYNPTDSPIALNDWSVQYAASEGNFTKITKISGSVLAKSYYLIQEDAGSGGTTDLPASDATGNIGIAAGSGKVALVKNIEFITGKDDLDVIDFVGYGGANEYEGTGSAPAPSNTKSIERKSKGQDTDDNLADFVQTEPKPQNSQTSETPPEEEPATPPQTPTLEAPASTGGGGSQQQIETYSGQVIVNEILINPEDSDADNEFVELYNQNGYEVDLSGWILEDAQGSTKKYKIPSGAKIDGGGFLVFYSRQTGLVLNNSGDGIKLFWPNESLANATPENSGPADEDISWSYDGAIWKFSVKPTAGKKNEIFDANELTYLVTRVIDGDTIELESGEKVRYIGIDTPENDAVQKKFDCFGKEALAKNQELVLNKKVRLEKDKSEKDDYGRLLRYVYIGEIFVNEYLTREGFASAYPYPPDTKYQNKFSEAEAEAKSNKKGLWQACTSAESQTKNYSDKIVINEILPNPIGSDENEEWIELKNIGEAEANISGWKLGDSTSKVYTIKISDFGKTIIPAQGFFIIKRRISGIALNNTGGDMVRLFDPTDKVADEVKYTDAAVEELSYARNDASEWKWTTKPTPNSENEIKQVNQPPKAVIDCASEAKVGDEVFFDGGDSSDAENDKLKYFWQIAGLASSTEENFDYTFLKAGKYKVSLTVADEAGANATAMTEVKVLINDTGAESQMGTNAGANDTNARDTDNYNYQIFINEVLPNPAGSDLEGEFIEIYNAGPKEVDLSGWALSDSSENGKSQIANGKLIGVKQFLTFLRKETGIALNNDTDIARLFDGDGEIADEIDYEGASEGMSYSKFDDGWKWTTRPTPDGENILEEKKKLTNSTATKSSSAKSVGGFIQTTVEEARNFEKGEKVRTQGTVAVEPGILGSQFFYIVGSPGIQVYCYKKDFPNLKVGDRVEVSGEISESGGEKRIKIATKDDIKIVARSTSTSDAKSDAAKLEPTFIKIEEIGEETVGSLVVVEGELIERSGASYFVDDGTGEIKVYFKSSAKLKKPAIDEGEMLVAAGIVSKVSGVMAILPRYQSDIRKTLVSGIEFPPTLSELRRAGLPNATSSGGAIKIPRGEAIVDWERYLWGMNGVILLVNAGVWRRRRRYLSSVI